jgi:uncharacterized protein DUF3108
MDYREASPFRTLLPSSMRTLWHSWFSVFALACGAPAHTQPREPLTHESATLEAAPEAALRESATPESPAQQPATQEPAKQEPEKQGSATQEAGFQEASAPAPPPAPYRYEPGAEVPALLIPRAETLRYKAYVDAGIFSGSVGWVEQTCTVAEQQPSILMTQPSGPPGETAAIVLHAQGSALAGMYEFESTLESHIQPKEWPRVTFLSTSTSSQTRRRVVLLGTKDGKPVSSYRGDTKKGAPAGSRVWREQKERPIPPGSLDMITAVFQTRNLVREGKQTLTFPLIDKDRVWKLTLRRGEERRMETQDGVFFDVVEVVLEPVPYEGESFAEKAEQFEGVFGIKGSIHLWVERKTGIAVRIQGELPVGSGEGIFQLGIDVLLDSWSGTPPDFVPVPREKK